MSTSSLLVYHRQVREGSPARFLWAGLRVEPLGAPQRRQKFESGMKMLPQLLHSASSSVTISRLTFFLGSRVLPLALGCTSVVGGASGFDPEAAPKASRSSSDI